jgi:nucleotide-binding universal stress UspA family protein
VPDRSAPVVVGVDGSDHADRALRWAVREAHNRHVGLVLVHAYADVGLTAATSTGVEELGRRLMADVIARHRELLEELPAYDASVRPASAPATAVLDAGRHGQLVVVGTRGLGGFRELLLGSTSHRVLVHAATPVAIVPTPTTGSQIAAEELDGRRPVVVGVDEAPEARAALRWAVDEACLRGTSMLAVHGLDLPPRASVRWACRWSWSPGAWRRHAPRRATGSTSYSTTTSHSAPSCAWTASSTMAAPSKRCCATRPPSTSWSSGCGGVAGSPSSHLDRSVTSAPTSPRGP